MTVTFPLGFYRSEHDQKIGKLGDVSPTRIGDLQIDKAYRISIYGSRCVHRWFKLYQEMWTEKIPSAGKKHEKKIFDDVIQQKHF